MISVIVCTRNRRTPLLAALSSLDAMEPLPDGTDGEILVVDNNSSDGTAEILADYRPAGQFAIRHVREDRIGHSSARNRGIREARGDWILFVDDDATVEPDWAWRLVTGLESLAAPAGGGRVEATWPPRLPGWVATNGELLERIAFVAYALPGETRALTEHDPLPVGCNMAFRRELFSVHGYFSERLGHQAHRLMGGEDAEFLDRLRRAGTVLGYVPGAVVHHPVAPDRLTVRYLLRRRYWEGFGAGSTGRYRQGRHWLGIPLALARALLRDGRRCVSALLHRDWPRAVHALGGAANRIGAIRGGWTQTVPGLRDAEP